MKFKELSGILCSKRFPLKVKGTVYKSCVRSVITYASETWPMKKSDENMLIRTERRMIRMMCGVTLRDKCKAAELQKTLGLQDDVLTWVSRGRQRWFGHVVRREETAGIKRVGRLKGKVEREKDDQRRLGMKLFKVI